jgi:hypothetical protein
MCVTADHIFGAPSATHNSQGYFLTGPPLESIRANASVPVMVGSNTHEMMLFATQPAAERDFPWNLTQAELYQRAAGILDSVAFRRWTAGHAPASVANATVVSNLLSL